MREIKFRGKPQETLDEDFIKLLGDNYNNGFVYGQLNLDDCGKYWIVGNIIESSEDYIAQEYWLPVISSTIGQYTGLKDCNDKEIYECDIVQYTVNFMEVTGIVKWGNKRGGFVVKHQFIEYPTKSLKTKYYSIPSNSCVIGNIYDNPELLEGD